MDKLKNKYDDIIELIESSSTIAIFSHLRPDGDTIGCALAFYNMLQKMKKVVYIFCNDEIDAKYNIIPGAKEYNKGINKISTIDLAISVDCASYDRLGDKAYLFDRAYNQIQIDHHISNQSYARTVNIVEAAGANAENVANFMLYYESVIKEKIIDKKVATCLYLGIITDTGNFAFDSVTPQTFNIAIRLLSEGIDHAELSHQFIQSMSMEKFNLKKIYLNKAEFYFNNKLALIILDNDDFFETNTTSKDTEGLIINLLAIDGVEIAVGFAQDSENVFRCSVRTKGEYNAIEIANNFNGGGHKRAAGCTLRGDKNTVRSAMLAVVESILK